MSKINQIQTAISELEGGAFQKLADSYLLRKGYPQINPIGSVSGSNKVRKGTPDTLIPISNGKYVFAEYTTYVKGKVLSKFSDDIDKCFDERKTGISVSKIDEIVLCYTSELSAKEVDHLREKCESKGVNLNLYGMGSISYDLLEKYPNIAKDYLGIEVDTGQIVPLDKFISLYDKNKLATTLNTSFHFRDEEKKSLLSAIEGNSLIIVSGQPGVGKSRLAIECYRDFVKKNNSYKSYCIFNQGVDLFEDLKSYFSDNGDYLIFVDDANRISGFQYILQLLQGQDERHNFKIIVTVRDYVLDKIRESCRQYESVSELSLNAFTDDEIKEIVKDEFGINNHLYLDRIITIAQGNPRVAIMAAKVAKESNTLESIIDVSELYNEYYSSIKCDLDALNNENILKTAGVVAFFRSIDRTNEDLMSTIESAFGLNVDEFWNAVVILHDMEIMDMLEGEVVKTSDQVLATYLFYLVFFKEKTLDFSILISDLFPHYKQRLVDAINPVLNAFDFDEIKKIMESSVNKIWDDVKLKDTKEFLQLIDVFWFLKPTDTLIFIQEIINNIEPIEMKMSDVEFKKDSNSALPDFLSSLSFFRHLGKDDLRISIELLLKYAINQPQATPSVLDCLVEKYGFEPDSYSYGYHVQYAVVEQIVGCLDSGNNEYMSRLFIALTGDYLDTHFSSTKSARGHAITITQFDLVDTNELFELRKVILNNLLSLGVDSRYQQGVLKLLLDHSQSGLNISVSSVVEKESEIVLEYFKKNLNIDDLYHCVVVQKYLGLLNRFNVPFEEELRTQYKSSSYALYDLITNRLERKELELSYDEYREYKKKKIAELVKSYTKENYDKMLHEIMSMLEVLKDHSKWQIDQGVVSILEELSARDPELYCEVIREYLNKGDYLKVNPWVPVSNLMTSCDIETVLEIISIPDYLSKNGWFFSFYQHLPSGNIKKEHIEELVKLYSTSEYEYFTKDLDYLLKYESLDNEIVCKIIQIVLDRSTVKPAFAHILFNIFNEHTEINKRLFSLCESKPSLIEDAYLALDKTDPHADYDASMFSELLDINPEFISKYLDDKFSRKSYLTKYDDSRDYSILWQRDDYMSVIGDITKRIFEYEKEKYFFRYSESFFNKSSNPQTDSEIIDRQDTFLSKKINCEIANKEYIYLLFSIVSGFKPVRKIKFYKTYLEANQSYDDFMMLSFEPTIWGWSGSQVPLLQERVGFYKELVSLCGSVEFLKHRQWLENRINGLRQQIQGEKKRDFTEEI